jgi:mRNA interferase RelE/StbE
VKYRITKTAKEDILKLLPSVIKKVKIFATQVSDAHTISEITGVKKMKGFNEYYRKRIGNYRIGFEKVRDEIVLIRVLKRGDIYKKFP